MPIILKSFKHEHPAEIASWPLNADEAKAWGGAATQFPVSINALSDWHQDPDVKPFVGFLNEVAVAYGEIWIDADEQEIELARIIVAPRSRGQGLGQSFVKALVAKASNYPMQDLLIRVLPENFKALRCYQNCGFQRVSAEVEKNNNIGQPADYVWLEYCGWDIISSD